MQNDLISRSALIKELEPKGELVSGSFISGIMHAIHQIKNAPAVDAVEVVRCENCEHFQEENKDWRQHCRLSGLQVDGDDFCSYGERRADNGK